MAPWLLESFHCSSQVLSALLLSSVSNARSLRWLWENIFGDPGLTWGPLGQTGSVSSV